MTPPRTVRPFTASARGSSSGFTLLELMVAVAVLAVLCSLVLQLMSSTTRLTGNSRQATDCDTEARYALNQIASDLAHHIQRQDVDAYLDKVAGNDRFFFFTEAPGYSPDLEADKRSNISLVGYRVRQDNKNFLLQRYARALPWQTTASNTAMPYVLIDSTSGLPVEATTLTGAFPKIATAEDASEENFYHTLAENLVRLEFCLIKKADTSEVPPLPAALLKDSEITDELRRFGFSRISSVVVTLAIVDPQNMARLTPEQIQSFIYSETFDAQPQENALKLPLENWNREFVTQASRLPKPLAQGLRFYQRVINL
jgi:prepilin-type N-terminal cleavage/methylation domain-containing protein